MNALSFLSVALFLGSASAASVQNRIVNGENAEIADYPYQVSLRHAISNRHFCGGSIIGERHILTAAHCMEGRSPNGFRVITGTSLRTGSGQRHRVAKISIHPGWKGMDSDAHHDLAVITLAAPIEFNKVQNKIDLAQAEVEAGEVATLTGWGDLNSRYKKPTQLQQSRPKIIATKDCQAQLDNPVYPHDQVCALQAVGGACSGDSGGPLVVKGELVGIVSWGDPPCGHGTPDVYTKVFAYKDFIESVMRESNEPEDEPDKKDNPFAELFPNWTWDHLLD